MLLAATGSLIPTVSQAQYEVFLWENFDSGKMPANLVFGHNGDAASVKPWSLNSPNLPAGMMEGIAISELGTGALLLEPTLPQKGAVSIQAPLSLNRDRLGTTGRALFQADFFIPATGEQIPNFSMLAMAAAAAGDINEKQYVMYRFGILKGGKNVFFSFSNNAVEPAKFELQPLADFQIKRPGWARFQIIFDGKDRIRCALNGKETKFSPITEGTLRTLNAGVMVSALEVGAVAVPCYMDNLSIQWTRDAADLPESPWQRPLMVDASKPFFEGGGGLLWHLESGLAWRKASEQRKPLLAYFHTPGAAPTRYLNSIVPTDAATRDLLGKYILLSLDANQLGGGTAARRFKIARLPTLLVMKDGAEAGRLPVINKQTTWLEVEDFLKK